MSTLEKLLFDAYTYFVSTLRIFQQHGLFCVLSRTFMFLLMFQFPGFLVFVFSLTMLHKNQYTFAMAKILVKIYRFRLS